MKKALIEPSGRVAQVEAEPFPVAPPLRWVDCPDDAMPRTHYFDGAAVALIPPPPPPSHNEAIDQQIRALEAQITTRMLVDAVAGHPYAGYTAIVDQIAALRASRQ